MERGHDGTGWCERMRGGEGGSERQSGEDAMRGGKGHRGHGRWRDGEGGGAEVRYGGGPVIGHREGVQDGQGSDE